MRELRTCPACLEALKMYKGVNQMREGDYREFCCPACGYKRATIEAQCWEVYPESYRSFRARRHEDGGISGGREAAP